VVAVLRAGDNNDLKLWAAGNSLTIQNVGSEPVTIRDLLINDRLDCSTVGVFFRLYSDTSKRNPDELHKFWVYGTHPVTGMPNAPTTLSTGDVMNWQSPCSSVVRVQITTEKGTAAYTFN
jgi:hypothetical protein